MPDPTRCLAVMSLALLAGPALSGCAAYETARVVVLDDVPAAEAIRRTSAHDAEPLFDLDHIVLDRRANAKSVAMVYGVPLDELIRSSDVAVRN